MLEEYKACLSRVTLLSREEEQALWKEYKEEEEIDARQRLIENYQPLVFKEAVKYGLQEAVTMDLIQEGTVGLMEAVERYDPLAGVAFSLYAIHRIRGRMLNFLNANKKEILLKDGEEEKVFLAQAIPDMAFESADRESLHAAVDMAVQRLSAKEQDVIRSVYLAEQTAAETADAMGVSQAYVLSERVRWNRNRIFAPRTLSNISSHPENTRISVKMLENIRKCEINNKFGCSLVLLKH